MKLKLLSLIQRHIDQEDVFPAEKAKLRRENSLIYVEGESVPSIEEELDENKLGNSVLSPYQQPSQPSFISRSRRNSFVHKRTTNRKHASNILRSLSEMDPKELNPENKPQLQHSQPEKKNVQLKKNFTLGESTQKSKKVASSKQQNSDTSHPSVIEPKFKKTSQFQKDYQPSKSDPIPASENNIEKKGKFFCKLISKLTDGRRS